MEMNHTPAGESLDVTEGALTALRLGDVTTAKTLWRQSHARLKDNVKDLARAKSHAIGAFIAASTKLQDYREASERFSKAALFAEEADDEELAANYRLSQADYLQRPGKGTGNVSALREAVFIYEKLLNCQLSEEQRGKAHSQLGATLLKLSKQESGTDMLRNAISTLERALEFRSDQFPDRKARASTLRNLGSALRLMGERQKDFQTLYLAAARFEEAARIYGVENAKKERAEALNQLGVIYVKIGAEETGTETLSKAIHVLEEALRCHQGEHSKGWSATQNNLGYALWRLGEREEGQSMLHRATIAFEAALQGDCGEVSPLTRAMTQNNLGVALMHIGEHQRSFDYLKEAKRTLQKSREAEGTFMPDQEQWYDKILNSINESIAKLEAI